MASTLTKPCVCMLWSRRRPRCPQRIGLGAWSALAEKDGSPALERGLHGVADMSCGLVMSSCVEDSTLALSAEAILVLSGSGATSWEPATMGRRRHRCLQETGNVAAVL